MKKILLVFILASCTSCTYKPRLLINVNNKSNEQESCFLLGKNLNNLQNIYHIIDNGWEKYEGQRELSYTYNINDYLVLGSSYCDDSISFEIAKINSSELHYSDTGLIAHGFNIEVTINFIEQEKIIAQQLFEVQRSGPYYSTLVATKKRIDKGMVLVMNEAFAELIKQVLEIVDSLE